MVAAEFGHRINLVMERLCLSRCARGFAGAAKSLLGPQHGTEPSLRVDSGLALAWQSKVECSCNDRQARLGLPGQTVAGFVALLAQLAAFRGSGLARTRRLKRTPTLQTLPRK